MNINKQKRDSALDHGTFYAFIPHRLEDKELNNFPLNILFSSFGVKNGVDVMGSTLYEPDLASFKKVGDGDKMVYWNKYGGENYVEITYKADSNKWEGEKFINGKSAGLASGPDWKTFFIHLTMLGLSKDERCEFKNVKESQ